MEPIFKKEDALLAINNGDATLLNCSVELRDDYEVVLATVKRYGSNFEHASERLKNNKAFVLDAIENFEIDSREEDLVLKFVSENLKKDKDIIRKAVENNGFNLQFVDCENEILVDREIVLSGVSNAGTPVLEFLNEAHINDFEIVITAISEWDVACREIGFNLLSNKFFILQALKTGAEFNSLLQLLDPKLLRDIEFMLKINVFGDSLDFADESIKDELGRIINELPHIDYDFEIFEDEAIILSAIRSDEKALGAASSALCDNKDFVLKAIKINCYALQYAPENCKADEEIVLAAIKQDGNTLKFAHPSLFKKRNIFLEAIKNNGTFLLKDAIDEFKFDKEIVLSAVKLNGLLLQFTNELIKDDKDVVLTAVSQIGGALKYASERLKNDKEVVNKAVNMSYQFENSDNSYVYDNYSLRYASDDLRNNKDIVKAAVIQNKWAIEYASEELKNDKEILALASFQ